MHGDFRAGNFIVGEDGIRCVLDWEIGQSGDPMQDLGWVCVKTWRFGGKKPVGGFGTREDLFEAYEKASGQSRRSGARALLGGVRQRALGNRMPQHGHCAESKKSESSVARSAGASKSRCGIFSI